MTFWKMKAGAQLRRENCTNQSQIGLVSKYLFFMDKVQNPKNNKAM